MTAGDKRQHGPIDAAHADVAVTDTGNAAAVSGATAVSGYRGPVPGTDGAPAAPVRISGTGDAAASQGGLANTGYIHQVSVEQLTMVQHGAPREPASWPHQIGVIPPQARSFQHRAEAERLRATVDGGSTAVLGQVLTGMGGVGKTQLAADYAHTAWEDGSRAGGLDILVWIVASTREAIVSRYAQAGVDLCRADPSDPEKAAESFLAWITPKSAARPCRWLIVLDDVTDPADLHGLWPPASPHGRTLVTTRRRDAALAAGGRHTVEVGLFTDDEALTYLTTSLAAHGRVEPADHLTGLADDLGHLPLALAQAVAYLIDSGDDIATYRALLADRTTTLADTSPDRLPDSQARPLAAAWSLSIDRADTLRPAGLARPMLQLAAMLDANGIPHDVLTSSPALTHLAAHRTRTGPDTATEPAPASPRDAVRALRALHRLSLIDHAPDTPHHAVRVHQLIQRTVRERLPADQYKELARTAADALLDAWPDIELDFNLAQALRANTASLAGHAQHVLWETGAHPVLLRTGRSLGEGGHASAAVDHYRSLAVTAHRILAPGHPDALTVRRELAGWRGSAGDSAGAAAALAELLSDVERVQGPDHPDTLTTRRDLAGWRGSAGDPAGAAAALAELLPDVERVQGPDHDDTLTTRSRLIGWRGMAGDPAGAAAATEQLLPDLEQVKGPDHPLTLSARMGLARWRGMTGDPAGAATATAALVPDLERLKGSDHPLALINQGNLAYWRGMAGDPAGAAAAFAELLPDLERVNGSGHPSTLIGRGNFARWRGVAGDAAGAAAALAELLPDVERVLGRDHPETLTIRGNLARSRGMAGDAAGAAAAYAELLPDVERVHGPDHPETLTKRRDIAHWRRAARDPAGAAAALAELLPDVERVLGRDHPETLTIRGNLAGCRGEAGDAVGAAVALAELLPDVERVQGPDHPETLTIRGNLACWRGEAGDAAGAAVALAELLPDVERVQGPDHPLTLTIRANLAHWRGEAGDAAGAAVALAELLLDRERVLGPDHPDTLTTRGNLADCRGEAGDPAGAAAALAELLPDVERVLGPDHPDTLTTRDNLAHWRGEAGNLEKPEEAVRWSKGWLSRSLRYLLQARNENDRS
ncbi:tetratricopeptide repeat protein [Streptomyces sp. NPDC002055]|uniref:tetratricopeptide repeat protein n=1 Tax=Streptomyces sp. NPDC002055 TaxID=3154534 RepID=UPI003326B4B8